MMYVDKNNFYGKAVSENLPVDEFKRKTTNYLEFFTKSYINGDLIFCES